MVPFIFTNNIVVDCFVHYRETSVSGPGGVESKWQWRDLIPVIKFDISSVSSHIHQYYPVGKNI